MPDVFAIEADVLPAERGNVGEQLIGQRFALGAKLGNGVAEVDGVPENDGGDRKVEAGGTVALVFEGAAPRLRDLSERRLYVVDRRADHGALDCLVGGAINLRKIEKNWDETLRMTASIRAGTVAPSVLMRRLAAYTRQNALSRALREIGCLKRTL